MNLPEALTILVTRGNMPMPDARSSLGSALHRAGTRDVEELLRHAARIAPPRDGRLLQLAYGQGGCRAVAVLLASPTGAEIVRRHEASGLV